MDNPEEILKSILGNEEENETKDRRVYGLFTSQVYNDLKRLANMDGTSVNNKLFELAQAHIEERQDELIAYKTGIARQNAFMNNPELVKMAQEKPEILTDDNKFIEALREINNKKKD